MKNLPLVLCLSVSVLISAAIILFNITTKSQLHSGVILSFFPIGAVIIGIFISGAYIIGKMKLKTNMHLSDFLIIILLGFMAILVIDYISRPLAFKDYQSLPFKEIIQLIIGVLFGLLIPTLIMRAFNCCKICRSSYEILVLKVFEPDKFEIYMKDINRNSEDGILLKNTINKFDEGKSTGSFYLLELIRCEKCNNGYLTVRLFDEKKEIKAMEQKISLMPHVVLGLSNQ